MKHKISPVKEIYIKCDCHSEVLNFEYGQFEYEGYCVSIYTDGFTNKSWYQRLRYCWRIISTGRPFNDQLMINYTKAEELADFINSIKLERDTPTEKSS